MQFTAKLVVRPTALFDRYDNAVDGSESIDVIDQNGSIYSPPGHYESILLERKLWNLLPDDWQFDEEYEIDFPFFFGDHGTHSAWFATRADKRDGNAFRCSCIQLLERCSPHDLATAREHYEHNRAAMPVAAE